MQPEETNIPPQVLPQTWTYGIVPMHVVNNDTGFTEQKNFMLLIIDTPLFKTKLLIDPDDAIEIGEKMQRYSRQAKTGLITPTDDGFRPYGG